MKRLEPTGDGSSDHPAADGRGRSSGNLGPVDDVVVNIEEVGFGPLDKRDLTFRE